jgi:CheY-like chemotaxis protein
MGNNTEPSGNSSLKTRILVADDDEINRTLVTTILKSMGYEITVMPDGLAAYDEFLNAPYHIILMDIEMPVLDGLKAIQRIREHERKNGGHIHIIAMTSYSDKESRTKYFNSGVDDYLSKPFKPFELSEVLTKAGILPVM